MIRLFVNNFKFLEQRWSLLSDLGLMAEKNLHQDPNTTMIKLRIFGEVLTKYIFAFEKLEDSEFINQADRLRTLKVQDFVPSDIIDILYKLKDKGNKATHEGYDKKADAELMLSIAYNLGVWFMQTYGDWDYEAEKFKLPPVIKAEDKIEELNGQLQQLTESYEQKVKSLEVELKKLVENKESNEETKKRHDQSFKAASKLQLTEAQTRLIIDEQLRNCGWEADTENIRFTKGSRPEKAKKKAISEWPTDNGIADYALFVGEKIVGIIEAKRKSKDIIADLKQAKTYAKGIKAIDSNAVVGKWSEYKVPFLFATNGRPYLKQLEEKSGIWFIDVRSEFNHPRALQSWYTPQGLMDMLGQDKEKAHEALANESFDYLTERSGLGLREYQINAIKAVEDALEKGKQELLLAMATGTGKTRTIIGLMYRLIKSKRFKRILFLVDRSALGTQAEDALKEAVIEDFMTFTSIYDVKTLDDIKIDSDTKIHIATVQGMVKRILYNEDESNRPKVDQYDCIIVDESHRGYILDKELGEEELIYRNEEDYISKYRKVLEYFDSTKIGLTATPAPHTVSIFGSPVFSYSYREAVIDGYLVDHEPPHILKTALSTEGIKWDKGEVVPIYDPVTNQIKNSEELPDELSFDVADFNKKVVTENFNRTVLKEIIKDLDPDGVEKTLIFAAADDHADMVVRLLKEEFEAVGVQVYDDSIIKITGSIKDPIQAIRKFKNEAHPNIVVTVDLLTTGVDVPEICNLVFLRRVKSRILYEQMIGRATRLCPSIKKTHFTIYDAVGVYGILEQVSNMKPVVTNPKITFSQLVEELEILENEDLQRKHVNEIIAKLQRKKRRFNDDDLQNFKILTGGKSPEEFTQWLKTASIEEVVNEVRGKSQLFNFLDETRYGGTLKAISNHADVLREHSIGYGASNKPEDYLQEFKTYINDNMNKLPALEIVCKRPKELTRKSLRELKLEMTNKGFSETNLNKAWHDMKNEDIAADIISFIRQQALGTALLSHEERIQRAMDKVRKMSSWNKVQLNWLDRFEKQLLAETIIDRESFEAGAFKKEGGFTRIDKIFGGKLDEVLEKINENLYGEGETA